MNIALVDNYTQTPEKTATDLDDLLALLGENESHIFRCTCDEHDPPRGSMDYDVNAFEHHRDCPSGSFYHYEVLLRGLARFLREDLSARSVL